MLGSVWVTYGVFTKKFSDYDEVVVHASKIGLQLPMRADVKIKGVIVGEVLDYEPTAEGADITLGLSKDRTTQIPGDVTASILPKTLFGEKFVSLIVPEGGSSAQPIADGDVIERTNLSTEVEQVLSDLYPLLRAVQPADLNTTLNAVATALEGRGEQLGQTIETMDSYLTRFNPELPGLVEDLRLTAQVSDTYADVLPEVATILRNTITTTSTLEDREEKLKALFNDVVQVRATSPSGSPATTATTSSGSATWPRRSSRSSPATRPSIPACSAASSAPASSRREAFRGFTLHIVLETLPNQPRGYGPQDAPSLRRQARPLLRHAAHPAVDARPTPSPTSPTSSTASTSRPARAPAASRPAGPAPPPASPEAATSRPCSRRSSRPGSASAPTTYPTWVCCWSARWHAGRRCRCDEPLWTRRPPSTWSSSWSSSW